MKRNFTFTSTKSKLILKSLKHELTLYFDCDHVEGKYSGIHSITKKRIKDKIKTSINCSRVFNQYERKIIAFHLLGKIRHGSIKDANNTNYAEIFISLFE